MKKELLNYLVCPKSGQKLNLINPIFDGDQVVEGVLESEDGFSKYSIERGIPNLIVGFESKVEKTAKQFDFEHQGIKNTKNQDVKQKEDVLLFSLKSGIDPSVYLLDNVDIRRTQTIDEVGYKQDWSFLKDKIVVDAGAASGRYARLVAPHCKMLILLDIGGHLYEAKQELKKFPHVHYIKCNLIHPPLAKNSIDFIYSIGVIHHTPEPRSAFQRLVSTLKPNGHFSIWMYPPEYWAGRIRGPITRFIRKRLLKRPLQAQVHFIEHYLLPIGRLQMLIEKHNFFKYLCAPLFLLNIPRHSDKSEMLATIIDYYLPEYIFTYTDSELEQWFTEEGLTYTKLAFPTAAIGKRIK